MVIAERPQTFHETHEQNPKYRVIGTRPLRPDGVDKVTGRATEIAASA